MADGLRIGGHPETRLGRLMSCVSCLIRWRSSSRMCGSWGGKCRCVRSQGFRVRITGGLQSLGQAGLPGGEQVDGADS